MFYALIPKKCEILEKIKKSHKIPYFIGGGRFIPPPQNSLFIKDWSDKRSGILCAFAALPPRLFPLQQRQLPHLPHHQTGLQVAHPYRYYMKKMRKFLVKLYKLYFVAKENRVPKIFEITKKSDIPNLKFLNESSVWFFLLTLLRSPTEQPLDIDPVKAHSKSVDGEVFSRT